MQSLNSGYQNIHEVHLWKVVIFCYVSFLSRVVCLASVQNTKEREREICDLLFLDCGVAYSVPEQCTIVLDFTLNTEI